MKLSEAIKTVNGFRYLIDDLDIISASGRRALYNLPFLTDAKKMQLAWNQTQIFCNLLEKESSNQIIALIKMKLMQLKDIHGTIQYVANNNVKDDIELFEIKHFAILSEAIRNYVLQLDIQTIYLPNLQPLIDILDPEEKCIPTFHIYDAYSEVLAQSRKEYQQVKAQGDEDKAEECRYKVSEIEDDIRQKLSEKIRPYAKAMEDALGTIANLDILIAKATQIQKLHLCQPQISDNTIQLEGMFNPQVANQLKKENKFFQAIDIEVINGATLIVGANMAGKSLLLKTVALVQYLAQFGFFVPCKSAKINPVEVIYISLGDGQNEMKGLSSFGAEMQQLNEIITAIENEQKILVLLDELARTTNPTEGKALVSGMVDLLQSHHILSLITTHYCGIKVDCNRLRVKGFREDKVKGKLDTKNINDYMDYSLQKDHSNEVPYEAIRIAEMLGVSSKLLGLAKHYL